MATRFPSPFPGMDPYLEDTHIWSGFHHSLAEEIKAALNANIGPKYYADVDVHTVFEEVGIATAKTVYPDVGVFEPTTPGARMVAPGAALTMTTMTIPPAPMQRLVLSAQIKLRSVRVFVTETDELVTSVEILSPYNKRGDGLAEYRRKRSKILNSPVHLVEIDLLRGGQRPGSEVNDPTLKDTDYILLVNRSREHDSQRISEIWPVALNEPLPVIPAPLLYPDPDAPLDLNSITQAVFKRAGYTWRIDYQQPVPPPKLRPTMVAWLEQVRASHNPPA